MSNSEYLIRNEEGFLQVPLVVPWGASYKEPENGEAILTWWKGGLRFGCNERKFQSFHAAPCGNVAKYDPDEKGNLTKCGHHSKAAKERRDQKSKKQMELWRRQCEYRNNTRSLDNEKEYIIKAIAGGYNDPRTLCCDWLNRKRDLEESYAD